MLHVRHGCADHQVKHNRRARGNRIRQVQRGKCAQRPAQELDEVALWRGVRSRASGRAYSVANDAGEAELKELRGLTADVRWRPPDAMAHAMWDFYRQHEDNELLIFHNHPCSPLSFLLDHLPLPSRQDRLVLAARALNRQQILRRLLGQGRILFYLGENGDVKEFNLPSIVATLDRYAAPHRA